VRLPHGLVLPIAYAAEGLASLTGRATPITVDGVRMARKRMFFSSAKAERELGYRHRPARQALADAVQWFGREGYR
jgi:dihydroflavonol-4-reductase